MDKLAVGILAHVDAGKTTLTEAMLYERGCLRQRGRVDHGDAFLDTDVQERARGITIFSKQAILPLPSREVTLLDTPGHVDFSSEMERTLQVMDYAILVISGTDGIQGHTRTLWQLLARHQIPVFLFVNKMDLPGPGRDALLAALQRLDSRCVDFTQPDEALQEALALCDDKALAEYLDSGAVLPRTLTQLIARRQVFPCYFGAALSGQGVPALLEGLETLTRCPAWPSSFGARVYKISRDKQGVRLTHLKLTGGSLRVKATLQGGEGDARWQEKVNQIRIYSGERYQAVDEVPAGTICAVTGLSRPWPGQGLGIEPAGDQPQLEPVLTYRLLLPSGAEPTTVLRQMRQLEEEDPMLRVSWNAQWKEIHVQLMGEVQLEVLRERIAERFGLAVSFDAGSIVYRETIAAPVEGVGHFEPLRHYAEVHLLLEPGERGSGLHIAAACSEDELDRSWQRLILTHLEEKEHLGVLTGAPITDMTLTLIAGRAHLKHTEGGDFRQAAYRAVRQGLLSAQSILLEPYYRFALEVPADCVGRAMTDLQRLGAQADPPQTQDELTLLTGTAPVASLRGYALEVTAYTRGLGRLSCTSAGYAPCHNTDEVVAAVGYDAAHDVDNTGDSVFCAHGAGFIVPWDQAPGYMHLPLLAAAPEDEPPAPQPVRPRPALSGSAIDDKELEAIFTRTYGAPQRRDLLYRPPQRYERTAQEIWLQSPAEEYLLVDGYNILFAWDELKALARESFEDARLALMDLLVNYQSFHPCTLILVFDAYRVPGGTGSVTRYHDLFVVYTKEAETADQYIEKTTYRLSGRRRVRVATSDGIEQLIILGHGAERISARLFHDEVQQVSSQIQSLLRQLQARPNRPLAENEALRRRLNQP